MPAKVITVATLKGGAGKTAASVTIAGCLAERFPEKKVVIIDMDIQANASLVLGYPAVKIDKGTKDLLENEKVKIFQTLHETQVKNLFLVPSEIGLGVTELDLCREPDFKEANYILKRKIEELRNMDDEYFVVIDTPPSLGPLTTNAFCASDYVIAPVTPDLNAVAGITLLMSSVESIRMRHNPNLRFMGMFKAIWNKPNSKNTRAVTDYLAANHSDTCFETFIPDNNAIRDSNFSWKPVNFFDRSAPVSRAYRELTGEILSKWKETNRPVNARLETRSRNFLRSLYEAFSGGEEKAL